MMRKSTIVFATLAFLGVGINVGGQSPSADQAKFQGAWRLIEETRPAAKQPPTAVSGGLWIFSGNPPRSRWRSVPRETSPQLSHGDAEPSSRCAARRL